VNRELNFKTTMGGTNYVIHSGEHSKTITCKYCGEKRDYCINELIYQCKKRKNEPKKYFCCYDCYAKYCKEHPVKLECSK
jgi:hypothetical protein